MFDSTPEIISIPLPQNKTTYISAEDADLTQWVWGIKQCRRNRCYVMRTKTFAEFEPSQYRENVHIDLHRAIMARMVERPLLTFEVVDHIDGNGLNNLRTNLRLATMSENTANARKHKDNKSGFKGVHWRKDISKWEAMISKDGKRYWLGVFNSPDEAHKAYCDAALRLYGEFARFE